MNITVKDLPSDNYEIYLYCNDDSDNLRLYKDAILLNFKYTYHAIFEYLRRYDNPAIINLKFINRSTNDENIFTLTGKKLITILKQILFYTKKVSAEEKTVIHSKGKYALSDVCPYLLTSSNNQSRVLEVIDNVKGISCFLQDDSYFHALEKYCDNSSLHECYTSVLDASSSLNLDCCAGILAKDYNYTPFVIITGYTSSESLVKLIERVQKEYGLGIEFYLAFDDYSIKDISTVKEFDDSLDLTEPQISSLRDNYLDRFVSELEQLDYELLNVKNYEDNKSYVWDMIYIKSFKGSPSYKLQLNCSEPFHVSYQFTDGIKILLKNYSLKLLFSQIISFLRREAK